MSKGKRILNLIVFVIGVFIGASLLTYFSYSQFSVLAEEELLNQSFTFKMPRNDVFLYAVTEANPYRISFNKNGWEWTMVDLPMTYDTTWTLTQNSFTRDWYKFIGWSETPSWAVKYTDEDEVNNLTEVQSWTVTLYAQRESAITYTIEYRVENIGWTWYDVIETGTGYGSEWTGIVLTWKTFTWFTLQTWAEITITSGWTVPYYYTRNSYNLVVYDRGEFPLLDTWVKFGTDLTTVLPVITWTWNSLSWWTNRPEDGLMPADDLELTSIWTYWVHSITFDTEGWTEIPTITAKYGEPITPPSITPTRDGYVFGWWNPAIPETMPYDDITIKAIWQAVAEESRSGWSGWWWRRNHSDESEWEWEHGSAVGQSSESINKNKSNMEVLLAYMWAHSRWIVDTSRKDSDPDGYVTRWAMAEMLVKFSEKVIGKKSPPIPAHCKWWDAASEWKSPATKAYAEKACALWVMWIRMQNFMPNKVLDRAEFGTILSRLLWWDKYDVIDATEGKPYYTRHLAALQREWVMTQIDNPLIRQELRKWAWLMLMRVESKVL